MAERCWNASSAECKAVPTHDLGLVKYWRVCSDLNTNSRRLNRYGSQPLCQLRRLGRCAPHTMRGCRVPINHFLQGPDRSFEVPSEGLMTIRTLESSLDVESLERLSARRQCGLSSRWSLYRNCIALTA